MWGEELAASCLAERLAHYVALTDAEERTLGELEQQERNFRRGAVVRRQLDNARELYIVRSGWLYSCVLLGNGNRQITGLHSPGDLIGMASIAFTEATDAIVATTDVSLCAFDKSRLAVLFTKHPRLAALLVTLTVAERVAIGDRLASIGRMPARARVASLICEIFARVRVMKGAHLSELQVPLTQEEIGDSTGLTAVHVNRMMRGLTEDGLIERSGNLIRLLDEARLAEEGNFTDRFGAIDTKWLPAPDAQ